ncbi:MAG TPA: GntR family transcriptional regulator [Vicinamibacterales bacterium]|nr:GntR family transcriptional regulator [Vicinamibacterales bacterium]
MDTPLTSLADEAYAAVRKDILRGTLRPGAPLSRRRLAEALGMSIVPIGEALRRLEDDRLIESRPRAGTRVRVHTDADVRALYELREALETQSARLFSQRATPGQRLGLRRLAEQLDVLFSRLAASAEDAEFRFAVHTHHVQFHMRVAEHARSPLLEQMIERQHVLILNWLFDLTGRRTPLPPGFHARLAEALASRDVNHADAAMRAHVRYGLMEVSGQIGALAASEWREPRNARG